MSKYSDDELTEGLLKNHREYSVKVRQGSVAMGYHPTDEELKRSQQGSWRAVLVMAAIVVVCVAGLMALETENEKAPAMGTPSPSPGERPSVVADAKPDPQAVSEWRLKTVGNLIGVFMDDGAMKSGDYRTNELSAQVFCPSMVKDVTDAMNNSGPAPDDQIQKHFVSMLKRYKEAGDLCVRGDMNGSFTALQAGEQEQKEMSAK